MTGVFEPDVFFRYASRVRFACAQSRIALTFFPSLCRIHDVGQAAGFTEAALVETNHVPAMTGLLTALRACVQRQLGRLKRCVSSRPVKL